MSHSEASHHDEPLLLLIKVPVVSEARATVVDLISLSFKFGLTLLGEPHYSVFNMEKQYIERGMYDMGYSELLKTSLIQLELSYIDH
jgi:hypothetical protein